MNTVSVTQPSQEEKPGEYIVLLDEDLHEIGTAPKLASHHMHTPLHKAFSCYIFDDQGRFLVTRRALSKKVWPGIWTNSLCGHPGPGESDHDAIARRAHEELGMTVRDITILLPHYRYTTPPFDGVIENEICPVYAARLNSASTVNPDEVEDIYWTPWHDYTHDLITHPDKFSYWATDQYKQLKTSTTLQSFTEMVSGTSRD